MNLLDDRYLFTEETGAIWNTLFDKYDLDKDGLLTRDEFQQFIIACNNKKHSEEDIALIWSAFETEKGKITRLGFNQMNYIQTFRNPAETIRDFAMHGLSPAIGVFPGSTVTWEPQSVNKDYFCRVIHCSYLDADYQFTDFARAGIDKIFDMYDVDKDNHLSSVELHTLALYVDGRKYTDSEIDHIKSNYLMKGGKLTRSGFREFCRRRATRDILLLYRFFLKHRYIW